MVEQSKEFGIATHASYIIGNPGETLETINRTVQFANELSTERAQFSIATPFPGTELWNIAKRLNLIKSMDFSQYTWYYSPVFVPEGLSKEELIRLQKSAYEDYYKSRNIK